MADLPTETLAQKDAPASPELVGNLDGLKGVQALIQSVQEKDLRTMTGAALVLLAQYMAQQESDEPEKEGLAEEAVEVAKDQLGDLKKEVPPVSRAKLTALRKKLQPTAPPINPKNLERERARPDDSIERPGSEMVYVDASILMGLAQMSGNSYIGKGGAQSGRIADILEEHMDMLKGKKEAVIMGYGNDVAAGKKPSEIMPNLRRMVGLCQGAGVECSVTLRPPYGTNLNDPVRLKKMQELFTAIRAEWGPGSGVKIIDLYTPLVDAQTGYVKKEFDSKDAVHLWGKAYSKSLDEIARETGLTSARKVPKNEESKPHGAKSSDRNS